MLAEGPAPDNAAMDIGRRDLLRNEFHSAVGQQQAVAGLDIIRQVSVRRANAASIAGHITRGDAKHLTFDQLDGTAAGNGPGPDSGPLQVHEDGDVAFELAGDGPHGLERGPMGFMGAVGEIEPGDVHPFEDELADHLGPVRARPERTYDSCAAHLSVVSSQLSVVGRQLSVVSRRSSVVSPVAREDVVGFSYSKPRKRGKLRARPFRNRLLRHRR